MNRAFIGASTIAGQCMVGAVRAQTVGDLRWVENGSHTVYVLIASGGVGQVLSLWLFHAVELPAHLRGLRLDNPQAGDGVIADLTAHNTDVARFLRGEDPVWVVSHIDATGLGQGVENSAISVWAMRSGATVFGHESFTHHFAAIGIAVHGKKRPILARDVPAPDPAGEIELEIANGINCVDFDRTAIYKAALQSFAATVAGAAKPAAPGLDGVKALQVAAALRQAALSAQRQALSDGDAA